MNQSNTAVQTLAPCSNFQLHKGQTTNNKLKTVILDIILKMNNEFDLSFLFFYPDSVIGWGENGGEICTEEKMWLITKFWLAHAPPIISLKMRFLMGRKFLFLSEKIKLKQSSPLSLYSVVNNKGVMRKSLICEQYR